MSREAKFLIAFLCLIVAAFVGEHIWFFLTIDQHSPTLIAPVCVDAPTKRAPK